MSRHLLISCVWLLASSAVAQDSWPSPNFDPPAGVGGGRSVTPAREGISARISDSDSSIDSGSAPRRGFALPQLSLPKLPKPKLPALPKPKLPAFPKLSLPSFGSPRSSADSVVERRSTSRAAPQDSPSGLEKLSNGTKAFFAKTADVLTPWDNEPAAGTAGSRSRAGSTAANRGSLGRTASNSTRSSSRTATRSSTSEVRQASWFSRMFEREKEEPRVETTNDFLSLPRIPVED